MIWNSVLQNMSARRGKRFKKSGFPKAVRMLTAVLSAVVLFSGCARAQGTGGQTGGDSTADGDGRISVVTTIFPPYDFVREIAGERVDLKMLLKPGEETHSYEPTPQDIIAIQNSDVFIYTGGENDVWVEDILSSMPDGGRLTLKMIDCVDTVEEEHVEGMKENGSHSHEHGEEEEEAAHSVHEIDEHVWTSPVNASAIAGKICDVLSQADPDGQKLYEENTGRYQEQLAALDAEFREIVESAEHRLLIFGDRFPFRYFADEYGLDYYAAFPGCAGDTEPSAATMAFLIEKVKEENVPAVLKMELSNADIANAVAEASGTEVRVFYSCHNLSAEDFENGETYLSMMQKNAETLKEVWNGWP